jgi:hypothetical protein
VTSDALARRLDRLSEQWDDFARDEEARLLVWRLVPGEAAMVDAFVARESDAELAEGADLFLLLEAPFVEPGAHGRTLCDEIAELWAGLADQAGEEGEEAPAGVDLGWSPPVARPRAPDVEILAECLGSLCAHQGDGMDRLALWLAPSAVGSVEAYRRWLEALLPRLPPKVRLLVLDDGQTSTFGPLSGSTAGKLVRTALADLDMPGAAEEVAAEAAKDGAKQSDPGAQLRLRFAQMSAAAGKGDLTRAASLSDEAVAIARAAGWPALAVATRFGLGAAVLGAGDPARAAALFAEAEVLAEASEAAGEQGGPRLRLQARMARGSSLLQAGALAAAAEAFTTAVPLSRKVGETGGEAGDARAELDCWRLAAYCHEQAGALLPAWKAALAGLEVARAMDEETRGSSTLPFLAEAMERMGKTERLRNEAARPLREIALLLPPERRRPESAARAGAAP